MDCAEVAIIGVYSLIRVNNRHVEMNRRLPFFVVLTVHLIAVGCNPPVVSIPPTGQLPEHTAGLHRESISVPEVGTVKYAIRVDENYEKSVPAPIILVLHWGYAGSRPDAYTGADMLETFIDGVTEAGGIAIAPDAVGGDWRSADNERSAIWLLQSAMKTYNIDSTQVYVTGFSMGGEGTWFLAGRHQDLFTGAIPVAAPVTGITELKIPVYAVHSRNDEIASYSSAKSHTDAAKSAGGTVELKTITGLTHYDAGSYGSHVAEGVKWIRSN